MILVGWAQMNRMRSVSVRLPLLISGLLLATVGVFSWLAYVGVRDATTRAATDHLVFASSQIADIMGGPTEILLQNGASIASSPEVRNFALRQGTNESEALTQFLSAQVTSPEALSVEIRSIDGTLLLSVGDDLPADALEVDGDEIEAGITPLYIREGTVHHETTTRIHPADGDTTTIGWVIFRRNMTTGGPLARLFAGMLGNELRFLLTNRGGGAWTDLAGELPDIPASYDETVESYRYTLDDGDTRIAAAAPIPNSPWIVWMDQPERIILAPGRTFLRNFWPSALIVVVLGTALVWVLTRGITDSIVRLATATRGLAEGDLERRMPTARKDEIGSLVNAFNQMAEQIEVSHHALEQRVEERTIELKETNRQLEEKQDELVRAERLATLGQLSSGVGHELRNPLGVMTNAVYYLEAVLPEAPATVQEYLGILKGQIRLSERIVGDLLDFARIKDPQLELVRVDFLVDHQIQRLGTLSNVVVSKEIPEDLPLVVADPIQIGQVVLNVLLNGVQAMADRGGTLHVQARTVGERVELAITDEGQGIARENIEKIFEPLFTTKARGIGLGLAVSRALVEGNQGTLVATSPPGGGATFTLTLPTRQESATE